MDIRKQKGLKESGKELNIKMTVHLQKKDRADKGMCLRRFFSKGLKSPTVG